MAATSRSDRRTWKARGLTPKHAEALRTGDARRRRRFRLWASVLLIALIGGGYGLSRQSLDAEASPVAAALMSGQNLVSDLQGWMAPPPVVAVLPPPAPAPVPMPASVAAPAPASAPVAAAAGPAPAMPASPETSREATSASAAPSVPEPGVELEPARVAVVASPPPAQPAPEPIFAAPVMIPVPFPIPAPAPVIPPPAPEPVVASPPPPAGPAIASCRAELAPAVAQSIVWFALGNADLQPGQRDMLREVGRRMADCKNLRIEIGGHTDALGVDGQNFQLSWRRAESVLAVLREVGVSAEQAIVVGHGARVPFQAARGAPDPNALNRRVEITLR